MIGEIGGFMALKKNDIFAGSVHETKCNGMLKVVERISTYEVMVEFISTGYITKTAAANIRNGNVKDRMRPSVCGVGYIGGNEKLSMTGGVHSKVYRVWGNMIKRCYDSELKKKLPTYEGCSVSEEWHNFQNFHAWYESCEKHGRTDMQVDKDILVYGNKIYSEETCLLVTPKINSFTTDAGAIRGDWPIGVTWHKTKKRFFAQCWNPHTNKQDRLGAFNCPEAAHKAWIDAKIGHALSMKEEMDSIDNRIYPGILKIITSSK